MPPNSGPVCISVINMKGGVGKTTIASLLARHAYTAMRKRVLAVDLDPQANLSQALMRDSYVQFVESGAPSIVELFRGYLPPRSHGGSATSINVEDFVVPIGTIRGRARDFRLIPSRFDFSDNLIESAKPDERVLARLIADRFQDFDVVIIDCAPTESIFTKVAYHASRYILVPVRPEFFATIGFEMIKRYLQQFKDRNPSHAIDIAGIVVNNWTYHYSGNQGGPETQRSNNEIRNVARRNSWHIFDTAIPYSRGFPKMMRGDYSRIGDGAQFRYFAEEFFERILSS